MMTMDERDGWIWLDGNWLPWKEARVHVFSHTLHYGHGCFEGIRAYQTEKGPAIFRLDEHLLRLENSCRILDIDLPWSRQEIHAACKETLIRNNLQKAYLRPLVFLGPEKTGVDPTGAQTHLMIAAWRWNAYLGDKAAEEGIRVRISSYARHSINSQMSRAKAISNYSNAILAVREARRDGYDEAILLDINGFVSEGSGENVFYVCDGTLYEPQSASALDGITRRTIHTLAADMNWPVNTTPTTRDMLYCADEIFLTGTAAEITAVVEIDRRKIGAGKPGPHTRHLQQAYLAAVQGQNAAHPEWLTYL